MKRKLLFGGLIGFLIALIFGFFLSETINVDFLMLNPVLILFAFISIPLLPFITEATADKLLMLMFFGSWIIFGMVASWFLNKTIYKKKK